MILANCIILIMTQCKMQMNKETNSSHDLQDCDSV